MTELSTPSTPDLLESADSGISGNDNLTSNKTPSLTGTAERNSTIEIVSVNADGSWKKSLGKTSANANGDWTFEISDTTSLQEGENNLIAIAQKNSYLQSTTNEQQASNRTNSEYKNEYAFAALKEDGSVITWGDSRYGGDSSSVADDLKNGVSQIFSTSRAFAALKEDGTVITWGDPTAGGDSSGIENLTNIKDIFSTGTSFAALAENGSIVTWGGYLDNSSISSQLNSGVVNAFSTISSFAFIKEDGSVVALASEWNEFEEISDQLKSNVQTIYTNEGAFAALKDDGSVVTWGSKGEGGDSSTVSINLQEGVTKVFSTQYAFAALKNDGSVITWGDQTDGGNSSYVSEELSSGVVEITADRYTFAALKEDGSVVEWGRNHYNTGGSPFLKVKDQLSSEVAKIYANGYSFTALKDDGSIIEWGISSPAENKLNFESIIPGGTFSYAGIKKDGSLIGWGGSTENRVDITPSSQIDKIFSTYSSFSALLNDGSVLTWGGDKYGGDSSSVAESISNNVVSLADPFQDDKLIFEFIASSPSLALKLTIDTTLPVITSESTATSLDDRSGSMQVVYRAIATDISAINYSLKPGFKDANSFSINETTGEVKLIENPSFNTKPSYSFSVIATDGAGNRAEKEIGLSINSILSPSPSPSPSPSASPEPSLTPTPDSIQTDDGFTQFTDGDDSLTGQANIKYRMMGGTDFLEVIGGSNYANGNMGEDTIVLRGGFGEYLGGKDSDTFEVFAAEEGTSVNGNRGEDTIIGFVSGVIYRGGKDNDTLAVSQGEVWGDLGVDVFRGVTGEGYAVIQDYTIGEDVVELAMDGIWSKLESGLMFTDDSGDQIMLLAGINDIEQVTLRQK